MGKKTGDTDAKANGQASNDQADEKQKKIDEMLEKLLKDPLVDFGKARSSVHKLARGSLVEITKKIAASAMKGNLPAAKYLFEMAGVYPVSEQAGNGIEEGSIAETLLKYLGLPTTLKSDDEPPTLAESSDEPHDESATNTGGNCDGLGDQPPDEDENQEQPPQSSSLSGHP